MVLGGLNIQIYSDLKIFARTEPTKYLYSKTGRRRARSSSKYTTARGTHLTKEAKFKSPIGHTTFQGTVPNTSNSGWDHELCNLQPTKIMDLLGGKPSGLSRQSFQGIERWGALFTRAKVRFGLSRTSSCRHLRQRGHFLYKCQQCHHQDGHQGTHTLHPGSGDARPVPCAPDSDSGGPLRSPSGATTQPEGSLHRHCSLSPLLSL